MKKSIIILSFILCAVSGLFLSSAIGYFIKPIFLGCEFLFIVIKQFLSVFCIMVPVVILARFYLRK
jgi:hypothetical protein